MCHWRVWWLSSEHHSWLMSSYRSHQTLSTLLLILFMPSQSYVQDYLSLWASLLSLYWIFSSRFCCHNSHIFLITILKFHSLIPYCLEENIKTVPSLWIMMVVTTIQTFYRLLFELQQQLSLATFHIVLLPSWIVSSEVKLQCCMEPAYSLVICQEVCSGDLIKSSVPQNFHVNLSNSNSRSFTTFFLDMLYLTCNKCVY